MKSYICVVAVLAALCLAGCRTDVMLVASYDAKDPDTRVFVEALEEALTEELPFKTEVRTYYMNAKEYNTPGLLADLGEMARYQVRDSRAKAIVCLDEIAIQEVAHRLRTVEALPFVVCNMVANPAEYDFDGAENVVGVRAWVEMSEAVSLMRRVLPKAEKFGLLGDRSRTTLNIVSEINHCDVLALQFNGVEFAETEEEWLAAVRRMQTQVDVILVGGMAGIKGRDGGPISAVNLCRATSATSQVPTMGLWADTVLEGRLMMAYAPVTEEQARAAAGYLAQLLAGRSIANLSPRFVKAKAGTYFNEAVAKKLNTPIKDSILKRAAGLAKPPIE
jgi:ABC-type uncharacterized transport system substrate-binding protein